MLKTKNESLFIFFPNYFDSNNTFSGGITECTKKKNIFFLKSTVTFRGELNLTFSKRLETHVHLFSVSLLWKRSHDKLSRRQHFLLLTHHCCFYKYNKTIYLLKCSSIMLSALLSALHIFHIFIMSSSSAMYCIYFFYLATWWLSTDRMVVFQLHSPTQLLN